MVKRYKNKIDKILEEAVGVNNKSAYFLVYINEKQIVPRKTKRVRISDNHIEIYNGILQTTNQRRQRR